MFSCRIFGKKLAKDAGGAKSANPLHTIVLVDSDGDGVMLHAHGNDDDNGENMPQQPW